MGSVTEALAGQRFGRWLVQDKVEMRGKWPTRYWLCICECGTEQFVNGKNLVKGQSNGCMACRHKKNLVTSDFIGAKFGCWTALSLSDKTRNQCFQYLCKCDCGFERLVTVTSLSARNPPLCTKCVPKARAESVMRTFWAKVNWAANVRGLAVEVSLQEALEIFDKQERKCALTALPIGFASRYDDGKNTATTASLDRIDSSKAYVVGNLQWLHKDVNRMKWEFSPDKFLELCRMVVANAGPE